MDIRSFINLGRAEGTSSLILFLVAMPLKYAFDYPAAVKYVGWAHGLLFVIYGLAIAYMGLKNKWRISTMALLFLSSIFPGGPFFFEKRILAESK